MKYAIIKVSNGSYSVVEEGITDVTKAKKNFHTQCAALWNASDVNTACLAIVDEQLDIVEGYKELVRRDTAEAGK